MAFPTSQHVSATFKSPNDSKHSICHGALTNFQSRRHRRDRRSNKKSESEAKLNEIYSFLWANPIKIVERWACTHKKSGRARRCHEYFSLNLASGKSGPPWQLFHWILTNRECPVNHVRLMKMSPRWCMFALSHLFAANFKSNASKQTPDRLALQGPARALSAIGFSCVELKKINKLNGLNVFSHLRLLLPKEFSEDIYESHISLSSHDMLV